MNRDFAFTIKSSSFDEDYNPSESTRITTNFANLARGENRRENLRNTLVMINNRFNSLAHWDIPRPTAIRSSLKSFRLRCALKIRGQLPGDRNPENQHH